MELVSLKLENFQGIKNLFFDFNGDASIYGDNATGKTTLANAFTWLLFDQSIQGIKNYSPKTIGKNGEVHNLEHSVEAVFSDTEKEVAFKKIFKEVYKKKRGSGKSEFTGHTTEYYKDGVPLKLGEYERALEETFGVDKEALKQLTTPFYFPEVMTWKDRRSLLLEVCGDISNETVFESMDEEDAALLANTLSGRTLEEMKKVISSRKTALNRDLSHIPERIDEVYKAIIDVDISNSTDIIAKAEAEIHALNAQKKTISTTSGQEQLLQSKLLDLKNKYKEQELLFNEEQNKILMSYNEEWSQLVFEVSTKEHELKDSSSKLYMAKNRLNQMKTDKKSIMDKIKEAKNITWNEADEKCPLCGQQLPEDQLEDLKSKFHIDKSKKIEELINLGKQNCSSDDIRSLDDEISKIEQDIVRGKEELEAIKKAISEKQKTAPKKELFKDTETAKNLIDEIEELKQSVSCESPDNDSEIREIDKDILKQQEIIKEEQKKLNISESNERMKERINELENEEKELAKNYEYAERIDFLCDTFIKNKISLLTENINKRFKICEFRLFKEQINGGISEDCEVLVPVEETGQMVPFPYANNAARINAGIEIIDVLSDHYGTKVPIFVDNAESVTKLTKSTNQIIRLVVSEQDKEMRKVNE